LAIRISIIERNSGEQKQRERDKEAELQQPEIPGEKPGAKESRKVTEAWVWEHADMKLREFVNLKEIQGFNWTQYLKSILSITQSDEFVDLKALDLSEIADGKLSSEQIEKLRDILYNGFKKNKTIRQIESEIKKMELSDRLKEGKLIVLAENRPNMIARTETVRLANEGLVKVFKENDVQEVRWLAAISDRTCPQCEQLNGQVFKLNELNQGTNQPPLHSNCRCSLITVI